MSSNTVSSEEVTLYVKKATPTSGANVVKIMILMELLRIPHNYKIITSPSESEWFAEINPYKMVPAISSQDSGVTQEEEGKSRNTTPSSNVFESSACLTFLADKYDSEGLYNGKSLWERGQVSSWLMAYTAGLGPTGKWWLTLKTAYDSSTIGNTLDILANAIRKEYSILEARLNEPQQQYIALPDRLTIADLAILPFANAQIAGSANIDFGEYPSLKQWSEKLFGLKEIRESFEKVQTLGHD